MQPKNIQSVEERREEKKVFANKIGRHLEKIRETKSISQENLSLKAGYYRTYVGKIENGKYSPSLHTIWRLAYALGMDLNTFFKNF